MKLAKLIISILCVIPLASCALEPKSDKINSAKDVGKVKPSPEMEELFYSIKDDGSVTAVDAKGNDVKLERVKLPIDHKFHELKSVKPITVIELKGSYYKLICTSPSYCYVRYYP